MDQNAVFKVRYTSGLSVILRYLPLWGIFAATPIAALNFEPLRQLLTNSPKDSPQGFVIVFGILFLILSAEILITFFKIVIGVPALAIDGDAIRGWNMWLPRKIRRNELAGVKREGNHLEIHKVQSLPDSGNPWFKLARQLIVWIPTKIIVPLKAVDHSETDIREMLNELGFVGKYVYKND